MHDRAATPRCRRYRLEVRGGMFRIDFVLFTAWLHLGWRTAHQITMARLPGARSIWALAALALVRIRRQVWRHQTQARDDRADLLPVDVAVVDRLCQQRTRPELSHRPVRAVLLEHLLRTDLTAGQQLVPGRTQLFGPWQQVGDAEVIEARRPFGPVVLGQTEHRTIERLRPEDMLQRL